MWQCSNYVTKSIRTCAGTTIAEKELEKVDINGSTIVRKELQKARSITVIPARVNRTSLAENLEPQEKRMAAYCRVSLDQLKQLSSYEAQVNYCTNFMNSSSEYEFTYRNIS